MLFTLHFEINVLELVIITIVNFFLSWIWYSPLMFVKPWQKALGVAANHVMTEQEKKAMPFLFIGGLVASFLVAFVIQVLCRSLGATEFWQGALVGAVCWAGFALTHSLNTLWEGRKVVVLVINNGLFLLTYAGFGAIAAIWR